MAQYKQISASNQIKTSAGRLYGLLVSSTSSGTIAFYDSPDGDTNDPLILATFTPSAGQTPTFLPGVIFSRGLYAVIANTLQVTIVYE